MSTPDHRIVRLIWPAMLAGVVSLFPFTVYSTFLVPIADAARADVAAVGTLRGLGGVAALLTGVALAPVLGRWPRNRTVAGALALLTLSSLAATTSTYPALVAFCLGVGISTAVLSPALLALATSQFADRSDGGRAATLVTSSTTLAAVLAAPVIGGLAAWRGWQGALWFTAALAALVALLFLLRPNRSSDGAEAPPGYREAFARLRARPDLLALVGIAGLRTTSFMGYLAFLAAAYHSRFDMDAGTFTLVWTLSGASFFAGGFLAGRWARDDGPASARRLPVFLLAGLGGGLVAVLTVFLVPGLPVALASTAVMGFSHAVVGATVTSLVAHRAGPLATTTFSLQAAGMSLGVFVGAALGGAGLSAAGHVGLAVALALPTAVAVALIRPATATRATGAIDLRPQSVSD